MLKVQPAFDADVRAARGRPIRIEKKSFANGGGVK